MNDVTSKIENCWKFVREDKYINDFEAWLYKSNELEFELPPELYLEVLSFNYKIHNDAELKTLKSHLRKWLESSFHYECPCITLKDYDDTYNVLASYNVDEYTLVLDHLEKSCKTLCVKNKHMKMVVCLQCNTHWYVGNDLFRDGFIIKRLDATEIANIQNHHEWPTDFDFRFDGNFQII